MGELDDARLRLRRVTAHEGREALLLQGSLHRLHTGRPLRMAGWNRMIKRTRMGDVQGTQSRSSRPDRTPRSPDRGGHPKLLL